MAFILITGFYPEPNPDNSLQFRKDVSQAFEQTVLAAMGWTTKADVPLGDTDLTQEQAAKVLPALGEPIKEGLVYSIGLCE